MSRLQNTWAALVLVSAALALGACGGDDNNDSTTSPVATGTSTTTGDGTTENGTTRTTKDRTTKTRKRERGDDSGGGKSGSGGGSNTSEANGGTTERKSSSKKGEELTPANTFSTAKTVCSSFLPKALERDLKSGKKSADEIARDYSKGYPAEQRKKAYTGCKAGLQKKD